jgi:putative membrane protein
MFSDQLVQSFMPLAQVATEEARTGLLGYHLAAVAIFSVVGIAVLLITLLLLEKLTPFSITKEIVDEHNTAMAIVLGAIVIGVSLIIAASIVG